MTLADRERCAWYVWQHAEYLINEAQLELHLTAKCPDRDRVRYLKNVIRHNIKVMYAANRMAREVSLKSVADIDILMPVYDAEKCIAASYSELGKALAREAGEYRCARFIRSGLGAPSKE